MMAIELVTPIYAAKLVETLLDGVEADPELFDEQTVVVRVAKALPGERARRFRPSGSASADRTKEPTGLKRRPALQGGRRPAIPSIHALPL
jgi:hypothetical protein